MNYEYQESCLLVAPEAKEFGGRPKMTLCRLMGGQH